MGTTLNSNGHTTLIIRHEPGREDEKVPVEVVAMAIHMAVHSDAARVWRLPRYHPSRKTHAVSNRGVEREEGEVLLFEIEAIGNN